MKFMGSAQSFNKGSCFIYQVGDLIYLYVTRHPSEVL